jgi:putative endonuclease
MGNSVKGDASKKALPPHLQTGQAAEDAAYHYLLAQGLTLLERNYSTRYGEIDLIMLHDQVLVFIEVRYRKSAQYGGAAASISRNKQRHIRNTAAAYLQKQGNHYPARFDVCAIHGKMQINWIQQAF